MLNAGLGWFQSANEIKFIMARQCKKMQFTSLPSMSSQNFIKEHFPSARRYELTKPSEQSAVVCVDRAVNRNTRRSSKHESARHVLVVLVVHKFTCMYKAYIYMASSSTSNLSKMVSA